MTYDYYLRADGLEEIVDALTSANLLSVVVVDGVTVTGPAEGVEIAWVGPLFEDSANTFDVSSDQVPLTPLPGFHVNLRLARELTAEEQALLPLIHPQNPRSYWL